MKVVVFGATGGTGLEIVKQALAAGHAVTAFVRSVERLGRPADGLRVVQGDVMDSAAVAKAVAGQEAIVSALGPSRPPVPGMMMTAAQNISAAMGQAGLRRLVMTTGAGVRVPQDRPGLMDHVMKGLLTLLTADVLKDSAAAVDVIQASGLDWTIVRFPRLIDGPRTGRYSVGYLGAHSGSQLSRADGADFVVKELGEGRYVRELPVVSYGGSKAAQH